ncbi:ATP-binding protein [Streptomyces sp. NBC_00996]|uniref:ATP-binding protein n=1 Tax=Streptomyces sp. NBC_00996 TaxID=2903710 RepID=UPI003870001C|nr:ATP-binding protein [Streptomyces sp. NBC_00996]
MTPSAPLGTDAAEDRIGLRATAGLRPGAVAERRFRFELAAHPGSVAQARRLARARLSHWAVCEDTCDTAALVVSELVTNAIVHAAGERVVCELHDRDDVVRIAIRDEGCAPGEPHPSPQRPEEEHGRGLLLVAAVSRAWGAQDTGPGLLIWAELERTTDGPDSDTGARSDLGWCATDTEMRSAPDWSATHTEIRSDPGWSARDTEVRSDLGWSATDTEIRSDPDWSATHTEIRSAPDWSARDTEVRSDLGWSAKKPPADGRGAGTEAFWGTGTAGVPPAERGRDWGRV